jgi:DNA-binding transcriptional LysR family regulator
MQTLRGILNFTRTAELGSFAAAAKDLNISAVAVSQNISRLEQSLGVRLFARSTRALQLTPEGEAFLEQCKTPLALLDAACKEISSDARSTAGKVRASVVSPLVTLYLIPLLPEFFKRYPDIQLELELSEDSTSLIAKRFDVGIRVGILLCASPAYLKANGVPKAIDDLSKHALLQLQITGQEQATPVFVQTSNGAEKRMQMLQFSPRFVCNDFNSLLRACIDGIGVAQLPMPLALAALKSGQLKTFLPESVPQGWQLFIHYPSRKQVPARVRAFVDFCLEHLSNHADLNADMKAFIVPK